MPVVDKQEYWHNRFATESSFEWLVPSETFMSILDPHLAKLDTTSRILHLGFGTSDLQNHLRDRHFLDITNVDYEPLAIQRGMQQEGAKFGDVQMKYVAADVTKLDFPGLFDFVIDKSTADAVACGGEDSVLRMAQEIKRHLGKGGLWLSLSYSSSRFDIEGLPFDVEVVEKIPTPKQRPTDPDIFHHCYLLRLKEEVSQAH